MASLLCASLGPALARAPVKALIFSVLLLVVCGLATAYFAEGITERQAMIGSACGILTTAPAVYFKRIPLFLALLLSAGTGLLCGAVAAVSAQPSPLLALPLVLVVFPARWIIARNHAIVLKVVSGWLIAVAVLAAAVPLITTAGYEPDHME